MVLKVSVKFGIGAALTLTLWVIIPMCDITGDEDTDSSPDSPPVDTEIPLVQISHCDEDDGVYEETQHQHHKPRLMFALTPSCSSSSLVNSANCVSVATQTDSPPSDKTRHKCK